MVWSRGNTGHNAIMDMFRKIASKLEFLKRTQMRRVHLDNVSDDEAMTLNPN